MNPRRPSQAEMQAACDAFNARHKVGGEITVCTGARGENPRPAKITYEAQILGGHTAVVYTSVGGCVALTHVMSAPPSPAA